MTVKELISKLKELDPESPVVADCRFNDNDKIEITVNSIIVMGGDNV